MYRRDQPRHFRSQSVQRGYPTIISPTPRVIVESKHEVISTNEGIANGGEESIFCRQKNSENTKEIMTSVNASFSGTKSRQDCTSYFRITEVQEIGETKWSARHNNQAADSPRYKFKKYGLDIPWDRGKFTRATVARGDRKCDIPYPGRYGTQVPLINTQVLLMDTQVPLMEHSTIIANVRDIGERMSNTYELVQLFGIKGRTNTSTSHDVLTSTLKMYSTVMQYMCHSD